MLRHVPVQHHAAVEAFDISEAQFGELLDEPFAVGQGRRVPSPDDLRADEHGTLVDETGFEQREDDLSAALDEQLLDAEPRLQAVEGGGEIDPVVAGDDDLRPGRLEPLAASLGRQFADEDDRRRSRPR